MHGNIGDFNALATKYETWWYNSAELPIANIIILDYHKQDYKNNSTNILLIKIFKLTG